MEPRKLAGKVVIVPVGWPGADAVGRGLAAAGATVVVVGGGEDAGRLAADIEAEGSGRAAVFASAGDVDALADFVAELFRPSPVPQGRQGEEVEADG